MHAQASFARTLLPQEKPGTGAIIIVILACHVTWNIRTETIDAARKQCQVGHSEAVMLIDYPVQDHCQAAKTARTGDSGPMRANKTELESSSELKFKGKLHLP